MHVRTIMEQFMTFNYATLHLLSRQVIWQIVKVNANFKAKIKGKSACDLCISASTLSVTIQVCETLVLTLHFGKSPSVNSDIGTYLAQ